ncbi:hypothetical protein [Streptomyces sp. ME18-1-4]|uniref:baeRF2 domain-containing protein n=1 Tax=Streptomyces sp. ME18-1-4 TaxID=3028685 RepID=UPI0039F6A49C
MEVDFQTGRWPSSAVAPERRCHRSGPAAKWPHGAAEIAGELADLVHRSGAEVIVLGGEVRARNVLVNRLPEPLPERAVSVADDGASGRRGTDAAGAGVERCLPGPDERTGPGSGGEVPDAANPAGRCSRGDGSGCGRVAARSGRRAAAQHARRPARAVVGRLGADADRYVGRRPGVLRRPRLPGGTARARP